MKNIRKVEGLAIVYDQILYAVRRELSWTNNKFVLDAGNY